MTRPRCSMCTRPKLVKTLIILPLSLHAQPLAVFWCITRTQFAVVVKSWLIFSWSMLELSPLKVNQTAFQDRVMRQGDLGYQRTSRQFASHLPVFSIRYVWKSWNTTLTQHDWLKFIIFYCCWFCIGIIWSKFRFKFVILYYNSTFLGCYVTRQHRSSFSDLIRLKLNFPTDQFK